MPDAIAHLGVLDRYYDPLGVLQDMSITPCSGRESYVTGLGFDCLAVRVGLEMADVIGATDFFIADLVAVGIVHFSLHVTPRITGSPNAAKPSKSYFA